MDSYSKNWYVNHVSSVYAILLPNVLAVWIVNNAKMNNYLPQKAMFSRLHKMAWLSDNVKKY